VAAVRAPIRSVEGRRAVEEVRAAAVLPQPARKEPVRSGELERRSVRHRGVDDLALTRRPRVEDAHADAEREQHPAAAHVADEVERHDRVAVRGADRAERARERDVVDVVARIVGERAFLAPARHASVHEAPVAREARLGAESQPLRDAGTEPLDQRVGAIDEPEHEAGALRRLEVDGERPSSAEECGDERLATRVGRAVDAHDLRAEVGEDHPAERHRADPSELHHPEPRQWSAGVCAPVHPVGRSLIRGWSRLDAQ